jgi:hypothetical protein
MNIFKTFPMLFRAIIDGGLIDAVRDLEARFGDSAFYLPPSCQRPTSPRRLCWIFFRLAHKRNGYLLTERMYGGRVFEGNPATLEMVSSGRIGL